MGEGVTDGAAAKASLRVLRPENGAVALGLAVSHLMVKPAFAQLKFGSWSRILVGQINRGHYLFVADGGGQIQGFAGWGLATRDKAEAWVEGQRALTFDDSLSGECLVFHAWSANARRVHRFMVDEARKIIADKETLYFKRHYKDGTIRPVRLSVNDFVATHIERHAVDARTVP